MNYFVDASIYIFRAWFSIPGEVTGHQGQPVNAAYGFARFLTEFLEQTKATKVAVAFDESLTRSFRNEIYPPYKMNRELPPEELSSQFQLCRKMAESLGLYCVSSDRYEADDLIGTLARAAQSRGEAVTVVSADKDLAQVLNENDILWDFARRVKYQSKDIEEKFGVKPSQIADYLGLCGDAVDNIPGVPGVGAKTAAAILQTYPSIDSVYDNLDQLSGLSIRGAKSLSSKLLENEDQARLSKELAIIVTDVDIDCSEKALSRKVYSTDALHDISLELGGRGSGLFERVKAL